MAPTCPLPRHPGPDRPPALRMARAVAACAALAALLSPTPRAARGAEAQPDRIAVLFLGDDGHHRPAERAAELLGPLARQGIDVAYTDRLDDLNPEYLARFDGLILYANHETLPPGPERALVGHVEGGGGLIALHCASACFRDSPAFGTLLGGRFCSHGTGVFRPEIVAPDHPALRGVAGFEAWDETYVHDHLTDDRRVLMERVEPDGRREPWTWVRTQGRGRVFYTASGHDTRVFTDAGFHALVAQGIRWAVGRPDLNYTAAPLTRSPAELPNYLEGERRDPGRLRDMQDPLGPAESMRHLSVPGGFRVELFAAEPQIVKPIAIAWDDRGRAYVAESIDYPNDKQPPGAGRDRIVRCEDADGDGRADRFEVFADGLSIPTSLVHARGGLIVAQAPEMLFLKDADGDGRAEVRTVLFSGFATDDTHAGPSNLRLGLDGWVYATVGYAGFSGTVGGQPHQFRQGLFRFRPDGSALEVLASSSNNTWGLGLTETGEVVYSTANGEHSSYLALPNRHFESVRGWLGRGTARMADHDRMHPLTTIRQVDHFGGFTAAAGHAVYTDRRFPAPYHDRVAFVCEPTGHLVHACRLEPRGSHLVGRDGFNLLASTDEWTAPIAAEVGPDGAVWVLDWYNYVVQHNPTPLGFTTGRGNAYETPLRDKQHGRIYRVVDVVGGTSPPLDLSAATPEQLVAALRHDSMFWRLMAQWTLVERGGRDVVPALVALASDRALDARGENLPALHALHTLHGLGATADAAAPLLRKALRHPAPGVRKAAVALRPADEGSTRAILEAGLLDDPDPFVRRAALMALAGLPPSEEAGRAAYAMLRRPENADDRWMPAAATGAGARHGAGFLAAALADVQAPAEAIPEAVRVVAEHHARGADPGALPGLLAGLDAAAPAVAEAFLGGLAAGWPEGRTLPLPESGQARLVALMDRLGPAGQLHLATLAARWGLGERLAPALAGLRDRLAAEVAGANRPDAARVAAARRLLALGPDRAALDRLLDEVSARTGPELAAGLLDALAGSGSPEVGPALLGRWGRLTPGLRRQAIDVLLRRPGWTRALLDGLDSGVVALGDLSAAQSQRLAGHPDPALARRAADRLAQGGRLASSDRQAVLEKHLPLAQRSGDPARGRAVFEATCAACHRHGALGADIAPDLTGFAVHPKEKLLTEILDPNRSVEGNFRQYTVATADGRVLSGLLAAETATALELVDGQAQRHAILRADVEEIVASDKSLMPEGFETQLSEGQIVDLLEFLAARGRFVPLPLAGAATVASDRGMFHRERATAERLVFPDWGPKAVAGVPFQLADPGGGRVPNAILLHGPLGAIPPRMPRSVSLPCNLPAKAVHLLGGVSGWGHPGGSVGSTSLIVRLHYADGATEDHRLQNGVHLADYIRRVDVPGSELAFLLDGRQVRYLALRPARPEATLATIEFLKGDDRTAPLILAVTVEQP